MKILKKHQNVEKTRFIYRGLDIKDGMQCKECGLLLDSVDDTQIVKRSKYAKVEYYCEKHKPFELIA